jgi:hypothetical protein
MPRIEPPVCCHLSNASELDTGRSGLPARMPPESAAAESRHSSAPLSGSLALRKQAAAKRRSA